MDIENLNFRNKKSENYLALKPANPKIKKPVNKNALLFVFYGWLTTVITVILRHDTRWKATSYEVMQFGGDNSKFILEIQQPIGSY